MVDVVVRGGKAVSNRGNKQGCEYVYRVNEHRMHIHHATHVAVCEDRIPAWKDGAMGSSLGNNNRRVVNACKLSFVISRVQIAVVMKAKIPNMPTCLERQHVFEKGLQVFGAFSRTIKEGTRCLIHTREESRLFVVSGDECIGDRMTTSNQLSSQAVKMMIAQSLSLVSDHRYKMLYIYIDIHMCVF